MKRNFLLDSDSDDENNSWFEKFWTKLKWGIVAIAIVWPIFPTFFPYHPISGFWFIHGNFSDWMKTGYYLFVWAVVINLISLCKRTEFTFEYGPKEIIKAGFIKSLLAGITEEILFRWIIFLGCMVSVYVVNWVLGGFYGSEYGIIQWFNNLIKAPIADYFTLGLLHEQIMNNKWYVGAALIISNGLFRDGHKYQGWLGFVNSWFGGMFLFFVMFKHGLLAAITLHFIYNAVCYGIHAAEACIWKFFFGIKFKSELPPETWHQKIRRTLREREAERKSRY